MRQYVNPKQLVGGVSNAETHMTARIFQGHRKHAFTVSLIDADAPESSAPLGPLFFHNTLETAEARARHLAGV